MKKDLPRFQAMSTTKKLLIVGGDSWTDKNGTYYIDNGINQVWPDYVAEILDFDLLNVAKEGMGNEYIQGKVIDAIEENIDRDIVVMVNWTCMNRLTPWDLYFCDIRFNSADDPLFDPNFNNATDWDYYEDMHQETANFFRSMLWSYISDERYPEITKEKFWNILVNTVLRDIYLLDKYCKLQKIPILHHRSLNVFGGIQWILKPEANYELNYLIKDLCKENRYLKEIKKFRNIVGHPNLFEKGSSCFELYEKYFISKTEKHPNEKGHQLIASSFVDKYIELYS